MYHARTLVFRTPCDISNWVTYSTGVGHQFMRDYCSISSLGPGMGCYQDCFTGRFEKALSAAPSVIDLAAYPSQPQPYQFGFRFGSRLGNSNAVKPTPEENGYGGVCLKFLNHTTIVVCSNHHSHLLFSFFSKTSLALHHGRCWTPGWTSGLAERTTQDSRSHVDPVYHQYWLHVMEGRVWYHAETQVHDL